MSALLKVCLLLGTLLCVALTETGEDLQLSDLVVTDFTEYRAKKHRFNDVSIKGAFILHKERQLIVEGDFRNMGVFFLSCRDAREIDDFEDFSVTALPLNSFYNSGKFVFDYGSALIAPKFDLISAETVMNKGEMYFEIGGQERRTRSAYPGREQYIKDADVSIYSWSRTTNEGIILVKGTTSYPASLNIMGASFQDYGLFHFINMGTICLADAFWSMEVNVELNGCIVLLGASQLTLRESIRIDDKQTIYMDPGSDTATVNLDFQNAQNGFDLKLFGFGPGSFLAFAQPPDEQNFDARTGTWLLKHLRSNLIHKVTLGPGYDLDKFEYNGANLTYAANVERFVPSKCTCPRKRTSTEADLEIIESGYESSELEFLDLEV